MNFKKLPAILSVLMCITIILQCTLTAAAFTTAETGSTIQTTLVDNSVQKGSKKTFDVIARDSSGNKIASTVTLNGTAVPFNWDDQSKTSYTLVFTQEGENEIIVSAADMSVIYHITYQKAEKGDIIGYATWSAEALSFYGFIIEPQQFPIYEGENSAQMLDRILTQNGFSYSYTGKLESGFYLSALGAGGIFSGRGTGGSTTAFGAGAEFDPPEYIDDAVPQKLKDCLDENSVSLDSGWSEGENTLGEFDYTFLAGWMYSVNNVFPNVGFSDTYLSDGDVVRVQFTLSLGSDINGGFSDFYQLAKKDRLYKAIASVNSAENKDQLLKDTDINQAYEGAKTTAVNLFATQEETDTAATKLNGAVINKASVDAVTAKINNIGAVTAESEAIIVAARTAYNSLPQALKDKVLNYKLLTDAEAALSLLKSDKEAVDYVIEKINSIGTVTLESEEKILDARSAYDALTDKRKAMVSNYTILTDAESAFSLLKADKEAVNFVIEKINAIGTVSLESEEKIIDARAAYDGLGSKLKGQITNYDTLTAAEKTLKILKTTPKEVVDKNTGIIITIDPSVVPYDTTVEINQISKNTELQEALKSFAYKYTAYEINLFSNNTTVQPKGKLSIKIPVPSGFDIGNLKVIKIHEDGTTKEYSYVINNNYIEFETDSFGTFAIAEPNITTPSGDNPQTHDINYTLICGILFMVTAAIATSGLLIKKFYTK